MSTSALEVNPDTPPVESLDDQLRVLYPWALTTARLLTKSDQEARDVVQDAMIRALERAPAVQTLAERRAWLRTTITRLHLNYIRRRRNELRALLRSITRVTTNPIEVADSSLLVLQALAAIPPRQRACVVLRYYEDLPEADIARALRVSVGTVKAHLSQARAKLRGLLDSPGV
ncbi:MAG TPA: sigma-70 family RNA polymerase sigma factor [Actinomycetota bacterium]